MICCRRMYVYVRVLALAFFFMTCGFGVIAQPQNLTSLKSSLQKSKADTGRVTVLLQICAYYNGIAKPLPADLNSALAHGGAAEKLSTSLNYPKGLGNTYMAFAKTYQLKKDSAACNGYVRKAIAIFLKNNLYREAAEAYLKLEEYYQAFGGTDLNVRIAYYEQALPFFQQSPAKDRQEATLKVLGDFYQVQGNFSKALQYLLQALKLIRYTNTIDKESLYDLLGSVYSMTGNLNNALTYGLLAIKMTEQGKDTTMQACAVYNRVGITYYHMLQFERAKLYFEQSLAIAVKNRDVSTQLNQYVNIAQVLTSQYRFNDCITLLQKVISKYPADEISRHIGIDLILLRCFTKLKMFKEALAYSLRVEAASKNMGQYDGYQLTVQIVLTAYYTTTMQIVPARKHLNIFKKSATKQHNPIAMSVAYDHEARLDSVENNFAAAYKNYRIAGKIKDSVWNENQSRQTAQLQIQFETEKKDQELTAREARIRLLNNQARLQKINLDQEKTTQKLIIGGAVLLAILLAISYSGYRSKQRVNQQLQTQRLEIEQKNASLQLLISEKDNLLQEKEWLMKEIHHRVKNNLQIVISLLSTQSSYLQNDIAYNAIRESQHRMQSISLIHQKLYQSDNLALVDVHAYISDLVDYLRDSFDTGARIEFEMDIASAELDVTRAVPLGLILNEAITNAIKYAFPNNRSGKITISLAVGNQNCFALKIHDDGVGFPVTVDISKSKSLGMSLMRGLSKQLGGSLKVENGQGITIEVDFVNETLLKVV
jgi:two-component sensor histidine kinase/tetratricopeptide (TPR) repeat protein